MYRGQGKDASGFLEWSTNKGIFFVGMMKPQQYTGGNVL